MTAPALLAPPRQVDLSPARVRRAIEVATANLTGTERALAAEGIARRVRAATRATRYPTPGALAMALDQTTVQTPALELVDQHLLAVGNGERRRLGIFMPPQEGKSTRIAYGVLWLLMRNPNLRVVYASYEQGLAVRSGKLIRDAIEAHGSGTSRQPVPLQQDLLSLSLSDDSSSMANWSLRGHAGGVLSVGIGGAFTGRPADVLVIDDPVKDVRAANSVLMRNNAWEWWTHVARVRLHPRGVVIVVQTRWHEDDLSGRLIAGDIHQAPERRQWQWVNIPAQAEAPRRGDDTWLPDALARPVGEFLTSARGRTDDDWQQTRLDVGEKSWTAVYQQHPVPAEGAVFRWVWFNRTRRAPDDPARPLPPSVVKVVAVDPSAGGHDEAGVVAGFRGRDGRGYLTDDRSGNMTEAQWARVAWLLAIDTQADRIVWEKNLAGPTMARQIGAAWSLLQRQAQVLQRHRGDVDSAALEMARADAGLGFSFDQDGTLADPDLVAEQVAQLRELLEGDRLARVLQSPTSGYCGLKGVSATVGKRTRATPVAAAFETGRAALVGTHPELEGQATGWQEGQDSPDRMDAMVWLFTDLLAASPAGTVAPPATTIPTGPITRRR